VFGSQLKIACRLPQGKCRPNTFLKRFNADSQKLFIKLHENNIVSLSLKICKATKLSWCFDKANNFFKPKFVKRSVKDNNLFLKEQLKNILFTKIC